MPIVNSIVFRLQIEANPNRPVAHASACRVDTHVDVRLAAAIPIGYV